jgi:hypothetical protein
MSEGGTPQGQNAPHDPLRAVWIAYWRQVTTEGVLLILGLLLWIFNSNMILQVFGYPEGLGWLLYVLVAGVLYLAAGWVIKPMIRMRHSVRSPRASRLPDAIGVILPSLRGKEAEEMREALGDARPGKHLRKRRLIYFAIFFGFGLLLFVLLSSI